jgi:hypothetical protein
VKRRSGAELAGVGQLAHRLEPGLDLVQQRPVLSIELVRFGHLAIEALVGKGQHAVGEIAPRGHQLVVVPWGSTKSSQETLRFASLGSARDRQGLLGVAGLGRSGGQVVAQGVGVVAAEEVGHVDEGAAALAELTAPKVEVFMVTMHK